MKVSRKFLRGLTGSGCHAKLFAGPAPQGMALESAAHGSRGSLSIRKAEHFREKGEWYFRSALSIGICLLRHNTNASLLLAEAALFGFLCFFNQVLGF